MATQHFCSFLKSRNDRGFDKTANGKTPATIEPEKISTVSAEHARARGFALSRRQLIDHTEYGAVYVVKHPRTGNIQCYHVVDKATGTTRIITDTPQSVVRQMIRPKIVEIKTSTPAATVGAGRTSAPEGNPDSLNEGKHEASEPLKVSVIGSTDTHDLISIQHGDNMPAYQIVHRASGFRKLIEGGEDEALEILTAPTKEYAPPQDMQSKT